MKRLPMFMLLFVGLNVILAGLILPSDRRGGGHGSKAGPVQERPVQERPCVNAPVCVGQGEDVRIIDLIRDGNRYDRRLVRVSGEAIMLRHRRSHCGDYLYFVLKDDAGYHVNVTDYGMNRRLLEERRVTVLGYYRAHIHEIQVCSEVNQ